MDSLEARIEERKRQARDRGITEKAIAVLEEYGVCDNDYPSRSPRRIDPNPYHYLEFTTVSKYEYTDEKISIIKTADKENSYYKKK